MISSIQFITQENPVTHNHQDIVREACDAGIDWVQFRAKNYHFDHWVAEAKIIRKICDTYKSTFIVNDNVEVALESAADGVHLGKNDTDPRDARKMMGDGFIIGATANTFEDIESLADKGVDYIGLGPFRFTTTKNKLSPVIGINGYRDILLKCDKANIKIPVIAIGGITISDIPELMQTGIHGIAVASLINNSSSRKNTIEKLLKAINHAKVEIGK